MFFNSNQNEKKSINTGVQSFYCDLSSLSVGCWDDKFSIAFRPAIGKNETGLTTYDRDVRIATSLTHPKASALLRRYEQVLKPIIDSGVAPDSPRSIGVPIQSKDGGTSALLIKAYKDTNDTLAVALVFARKLTPAGTTEDNVITYKFNAIETLDDYDPLSADDVKSVFVQGEFLDFIDILKARKLATGLNAHAQRVSNQYTKRGIGAHSSGDEDGFGGTSAVEQEELPFNEFM